MPKTQKNILLSGDFINFIANSSAGYISENDFESIINCFEAEAKKWRITRGTESNLIRIISSLYDKNSFLLDSTKYPHYVEILMAIAVNSNYLADIIVRNPEYLYWILNSKHLKKSFTAESFSHELNKTIEPYKSFNRKVNALRLIKRREILRIGLKDILNEADLSTITKELSILAKCISAALFKICLDEICKEHKIENLKKDYVLVALGKLGGDELNYSSDIDLILFYDSNRLINGIEYYEILTKALHLFIESASSKTENGFLYRVDFRLRPDGRTSPLSRTLNDYLRYYEIRGEDWERQMLIKMSFVCGSEKLYETFNKYLQPFVYPSSFTVSPIEQIKRLKKNIEKRLGLEDNIKLQSGGIRDIEFAVQALQLLNGGRIEQIKSSNTLYSIEMLNKYNLISIEEKKVFVEAYNLYRKIEHYLQLMNDTQTHTIPEDGEIVEKLVHYLGFKTAASFKKKINEMKKNVSEIFYSIVEPEKSTTKDISSFSSIKFKDKTKALKNLDYLRTGTGLLAQKQFDKQSIDAFNKIEERLTDYLFHSLQPDKVLQNFVRLIKGSHFPSIWYEEFADDNYFSLFLSLCEFSQFAIDLFAEDKILRELYLSKKCYRKISDELLIQYKPKEIIFTLAVQLTGKILTPEKVSQLFTLYFKKYISFLVESYSSKKLIKYDFFIAGLGSFGSEEMSFSSDIDIIIVARDISKYQKVENDFVDLLNYLKKELQPVQIDSRLRPEGKSGNIVWDINSCKVYIEKRAGIWELQTYSKLRFICGNENLFKQFTTFSIKRVQKEDSSVIKNKIIEMRKRLYPSASAYMTKLDIKKSRGGLLDIDFILQYLLLKDYKLYNSSIGLNKKEIIYNFLINEFSLTERKKLFENFIFFKQIEMWNQNIFHITNDLLPDDNEKKLLLAKAVGINSIDDFNNKLKKAVKENISLYENFLGDKK